MMLHAGGRPLSASEHEEPSVDVDRNTASLKQTERQLERADSPPDDKLLRCLSDWERASAALRPLTKTERQQVALNRRDRYSGHELAVICDLCGPVDLSELLKHYRWVDCRRQSDTLRLTAEPRDMAASLFFREFQIALDAASRLPRSIEFTDRQGTSKGEPVLLAGCLNLELNESTRTVAGDFESPATNVNGPSEEMDVKGVRLASANTSQRDQPTSHESVVSRILGGWRESAAGVRTFQVDFERLDFDHTFRVVKGTAGTFYYEAPHKLRIDFLPAMPDVMQHVSLGQKGRDYDFKQRSSETWVLSATTLLQIDHVDRSYASFGRRKPWFLPFKDVCQMFVLSVCPQQWHAFTGILLNERFRVSIAEQTGGEIRLLIEALRSDDAISFGHISITVDTKSDAVKSTRFVDPAGRTETVLVIDHETARVNQPWRSGDDPFRPNLEGYRQR